MSNGYPKPRRPLREWMAMFTAGVITIAASPIIFGMSALIFTVFLADSLEGHEYLLYPLFAVCMLSVGSIIAVLIKSAPEIATLLLLRRK